MTISNNYPYTTVVRGFVVETSKEWDYYEVSVWYKGRRYTVYQSYGRADAIDAHNDWVKIVLEGEDKTIAQYVWDSSRVYYEAGMQWEHALD